MNIKGLFFLAILLFFAILLCTPVHSLAISRADGTVAARYMLTAGEEFSIRYIHSVQKTPVIEVFTVNLREGIELRETLYKDFGAGLPFLVEGSSRFKSGGGWYRLYGIRRYLRDMVFRVGRFADFTLLRGGKEIPLTRFERPGGSVRFTGETRPLLFSFF